MFDNVIVSGCSFTWGDELVERENRYSLLVANHFNAKLHDFSRNGNSNELIVSSVTNNTAQLLNDHTISPDNTLVMIQWTHRERLHYYSQSNKYFRVSHDNTNSVHIKKAINRGFSRLIEDEHIDNMDLKHYYENHAQPAFLTYNLICKIHHAQTFLQSKRLKYIFLFASAGDQETLNLNKDELELLRTYKNNNPKLMLPDVSGLAADIDMSKVYSLPFLTFCKQSGLPTAMGGHPREDTHIQYSKHLIDFIRRLYD